MWIVIGLALFLLSSPALAAKFDVPIEAKKSLQKGKQHYSPIQVPDDVTVCEVTADLTDWPDTTTQVRLWMDLSMNGREDWDGMEEAKEKRVGHWVEATVLLIDKTVLPTAGVRRELPAGTNRWLRGGYEVLDKPVRTALAVHCE